MRTPKDVTLARGTHFTPGVKADVVDRCFAGYGSLTQVVEDAYQRVGLSRLRPIRPIDRCRYSYRLPNETAAKCVNITNLACHQHFCERTTGFEPATLTLAR
jgi:hypothetical protein